MAAVRTNHYFLMSNVGLQAYDTVYLLLYPLAGYIRFQTYETVRGNAPFRVAIHDPGRSFLRFGMFAHRAGTVALLCKEIRHGASGDLYSREKQLCQRVVDQFLLY